MKHISTSTPVSRHFDALAHEYDGFKKRQEYYYSSLKKLLSALIPPNQTVLEIGCGTGELLASLHPRRGVGMDISTNMIHIAQAKFPQKNLTFICSPLESFHPNHSFDYIFMSDVIEHLPDLSKALKSISTMMGKNTKLINTMANPIWEPVLMLAENLNLKMKEGPHYRYPFATISSLLQKNNLTVTSHSYTTLIPKYIPFLTPVANTYIEPLVRPLSFIEYFVAEKSSS